MKNIIATAFLLLGLGATVSGQTTNSVSRQVMYGLDFVFTGEINSPGDSVFWLRYTFSPADVSNLKNVTLEDSRGQHQVALSKAGMQGDMEVKKETDGVRVLVHKYQKYDLPVLTLGEDLQGARYALFLSTGNGQPLSAEQFRTRLKSLRERAEQIGQHPVSETDQVK